jgi:hypothetical protein
MWRTPAVIIARFPARKTTLQPTPPSSLMLSPAEGGAVVDCLGRFPHFHKQGTACYWDLVQDI